MNPAEIEVARKMFHWYRGKGWNPLPSRTDAKQPMVRYREYWEELAPGDLFDLHPTTNLQVVTGRRWGLLVIDLDGEEAIDRWSSLCPAKVKTWQVSSGGGSRHLWFRVPRNFKKPLPKGFLWRGEEKHTGIERLCDHSLATAPPSFHVKDRKRRYMFDGHLWRTSEPAWAPSWLLAMPTIEETKKAERKAVEPLKAAQEAPVSPKGKRYRASDVRDAVRDKVALAASCGLRLAQNIPDSSGWVQCHAFGRDDRTPSAQIHAESGYYVDFADRSRDMPFFDLLANLGYGPDWQSVCQQLGDRYGARTTD